MKKITWKLTFGKSLFIIVFLLSANFVTGQCPTITNTNQTFCDVANPQVSSLAATDEGGGVFWYLEATGGNALPPNVPLQDNVVYFADDGSGNCGPRPSVLVRVFGEPPTNVDVAVSRCSSDVNTIAQLSADGSNIEWYDAQTNGNLLPSTTELVDGFTYWVQQTENGCTSRRLPTRVTIIDPGAPTGEPEQFFCIDPDNPVIYTVADLVANGTEITWYDSNTSTLALDPATPLIPNEDYYATQTTFPCESQDRYATIVRFDNAVDAGENASLALCEDATASVDLFDILGGTPDNGGNWSGPIVLANGDRGSLDPSLLNPGAFTFTYTVPGQNACPDETATVTVTVQQEPNAGEDGQTDLCSTDPAIDLFSILGGNPDAGGTWSPTLASGTGVFDPAVDTAGTYTYTVAPTSPCTNSDTATIIVNVEQAPFAGNDANVTICENDAPVDLTTLLGGSPDTGGVWSPALTSGTGVFDPAQDPAGTYTYTLAATALCPEDSATVTITIETPPNAGDDGTIELCSNDTAIDLFSLLGGNPDTGGTWLPALSSGTGVFDPAVDTQGTYTYTVSGTGVCADDTSEVAVTVEQAPFAGNDGAALICENDASFDLFTLLGGSPDSGGSWSPALASGTGVFDPTVDNAGTYAYTVAGTAICNEDTATVTITIETPPNAGEDSTNAVCSNDAPVDLFTFLGGTPDTGGTWSPALTSGTGVFDPAADTAGTYTYTVTGANACTDDSATVTISIETAPDPGINGSALYCENDPPIDLFTLLGGTPDTGGAWTPALASGTGVFDPAVDSAGTYTYTIAATDTCEAASSTVTITLETPPNAGTDASLALCTNDTTVDLFTILGGNPDSGGVWSPALTSGTGVFDPAVDTAGVYTYTVTGANACADDSAEITVSISTAPNAGANNSVTFCADDSAINLFDLLGINTDSGGNWSGPGTLTNGDQGTFDPASGTPGSYTYTVAGTGACEDATATVVVEVINPQPTITPGNEIFCAVDNPTIADLIANITPDQAGTITVYDAAVNGNSIDPPTALVDGTTYYITETDTASGCETTNRLEVIIAINDPASPTISTSDVAFCLIDQPIVGDLNNLVTSGGTIVWYDALQNGLAFSDSDPLVTGTYYAATQDNNGCTSTTRIALNVTVNNNPAPSLINEGNLFCGASDPTLSDLENNLQFDSGLTILWYDAQDGGTQLNTSTPLLNGETYYAATFNSTTGCESFDRLPITVDLTDCDPNEFTLFIPDGFSPNNDGINDTFELVDIQFLFPDYTIEIYNRYGNIVYKGDASAPFWNGVSNQTRTIGNNVVPNGVYFYIINFNRGDMAPKQGRLYLNR
ncbi:gliding motility-associated C-terminal domain-containing protein [Flavobacteriaceae bacterium M23B6Z8]